MHDYRPTYEEYLMYKTSLDVGHEYLVQPYDRCSENVLAFLRWLVADGHYHDCRWNGYQMLITACRDWVVKDEHVDPHIAIAKDFFWEFRQTLALAGVEGPTTDFQTYYLWRDNLPYFYQEVIFGDRRYRALWKEAEADALKGLGQIDIDWEVPKDVTF